MAKNIAEQIQGKKDGPTLEVDPRIVREGDQIIIRGSGWGDCPVKIELDGKVVKPTSIAQGFPLSGGIRPDATGSFVVRLSTLGVRPGNHKIVATSTHEIHKARITEQFEIGERPRFKPNGRVAEPYYWRALDFFNRRFGHIGIVPPGTRETQIRQIRSLREKRNGIRHRFVFGEPSFIEGMEPSMPVTGVCNWNPVGAGPVPKAQTEGSPTQPVSGRTLAIAIDPITPSTVYIGTAGGGVWKSTDNGVTWSPKTDYKNSLAVGALAIDPNNTLRVFAGTGEYNNGYVGTYYGNGILQSPDGGNTWNESATSTFERDEISRILFDPTDATSQRMFLSSSIGVYESTDGGVNWPQLRAGSASDLVLIANAGPPATVQLIAAFYGSGLWTSTRTGTTWSAWTQITSASFPATFGRIGLGQSKNNPQTIYAIFESGGAIQGIAKTPDGGSSWTSVTIRLNTPVYGLSTSAAGHQHSATIPAADLTALPTAHTYITTSAGMPAHTHTISLTASEIEQLAAGKPLTKNTDADSSGHQHTFSLGITRQAGYNLHISVHPTDTNTVYFGEVRLWKNTTGGGVFNDITDGEPVGPPPAGIPIGIHVDQHAFAFDPGNPDIIWACNDGGVYRSDNGGQTWSYRNRDLATLQYMHISLHPQWEAVMLGGTQDNGTHRYSGNPAWEFSDYGDGGFTAIDPNTPTRMYHGYVDKTFYRSDSAGAKGTWAYKTGTITGSAEFYPPFTLDQSDPNVCYFGGDKLWRSPDNADNWEAITNALTGNITAIAVHPTDSTMIYAGTTQGRVYRVQKTGATWALADVTTTDLTGADIPANVYISDIAVDTAGTVWVTVSSVQWTEYGETFTNNHVYRRLASGTTWEPRSNGLAQANPINTIVIDPTNNNRLFCGGDVGVFRTEDAGASWVPWDEGLPNVPVFHLTIHGPRRLLRAATHGRSVWERPIDTAVCPMVDLYLRDNILDTGRVQPTPSGQPHPFNLAANVYWWQSVDIKVDAEEGSPPSFQTPTPITDYVAFESDLQHRTARRNRVNRFYVQVHNRGVSKATNVQVRAFFADASAGLPSLPADFWSAGKPFVGTPSGTAWTPIGPTKTISELEAAEPGVVEWDWTVPGTASQHSCLLALATCTENPLDGTGILDVGTLVTTRKQVTLKNLHVEDAVPGSPMQPEQVYILELHNPYEQTSTFDLVFHWGNLPKETRIFIAFEKLPDKKPAVIAKPEDLKRFGIEVVCPKEKLFPEKQEGRCGEIRYFDIERIYQLSPTKDGTTMIPSVRIPNDRPLIMAINLLVPKDMKEENVQFDIIQQSGKRIIGGSTYLLRQRKKK